MKRSYSFLTTVLLTSLTALPALHVADDAVTWIVHYDGATLPDSTWTAVGKPDPKLENGALHLVDDSTTDSGAYRAMCKW